MEDEVTLDQLLAEPVPKPDNQQAEPVEGSDNLEKTTPIPSLDADGNITKPIESEVAPYTSEELKSIPIERLDPNRVPELAKPYYEAGLREKKGLQAEFTRKSQELSQMRSGNQPRNLEEAFDRDPSGVLDRIGQEIDNREIQLANIDPMLDPDNAKLLRVEIARLRSLDRNLNQRSVAIQRQAAQGNAIIADTMSEVRKSIKDYDSKRARIVGKAMAIKNFKAINALFEKAEAFKTAEKKMLKPNPNQLEKDTVSSEKEEGEGVYNSPETLKTFLGV